MSRWGYRRSEEEQTIDLEHLLQEKKSAIQLLKTINFQAEIKNQSSKFTQLIVKQKNRHLLYELIDIATNPTVFMKTSNSVVDKTLTHSAIQTLTCLTQQFMECVFESKVPTEDEVIQSEQQYPILNYILKVLSQKDAEETSLAYLVKLISPFIYQRPQEMIKIVSGHNSGHFLQYFQSKSILDLWTKLLQTESESNFFEEQKVSLVHKVCEFVRQTVHANSQGFLIQNFALFLEFIAQKHEDQYDRAKYTGFINRIVAESQYFVFLINEMDNFDSKRPIKVQLLHSIQAFLRIHIPYQAKNAEDTQSGGQKLQITEPFLGALVDYLQNNRVNKFRSEARQQLLNYYKIIKALKTIQPAALAKIIDSSFLQQTLSLMQSDPQNNILHNIQKDVILTDLDGNPQMIKILQQNSQLLALLKKYLTPQNSDVSFQSQLFLIGEAVKPKQLDINNDWSQIQQTLQDKRKFYLTQIGGDPRKKKDRWSDFQEEVFEKVVFNKLEKGKEGNGVRIFSKISEAPSDLLGMQGAEVLSNQMEEPSQKQPVIDDFFDSQRYEQMQFQGENQQKNNFFIMKFESFYLTPVREQIETDLKARYNLNLNIFRL